MLQRRWGHRRCMPLMRRSRRLRRRIPRWRWWRIPGWGLWPFLHRLLLLLPLGHFLVKGPTQALRQRWQIEWQQRRGRHFSKGMESSFLTRTVQKTLGCRRTYLRIKKIVVRSLFLELPFLATHGAKTVHLIRVEPLHDAVNMEAMRTLTPH